MRTSVVATMGIAALLASFSGAARAWEEPDAAYARYHNAILTGNAEEMLRLTPAARRAEVAARRDLELRQQTASMPVAYALDDLKLRIPLIAAVSAPPWSRRSRSAATWATTRNSSRTTTTACPAR